MEDFAGIAPDLYADAAVGGLCLFEAVVDVGTESLKRNGSLVIRFLSGDFGTAYAAGNLNFDTLCAELHGTADSHFHGSAEGSSLFELCRDAGGDELSVQVGVLDLNNVDDDRTAELLLTNFFELVDFCAAAADNDTGLCAVDKDADALCGSFDFDLRNTGRLKELQKVLTKIVVLNEGIAEILVLGEPTGVPVFDDARTQTVGISSQSHK